MGNKLEDRHFDFFVECCKAWLDHFGLLGWEIHFAFMEAEVDSPKAALSVEDFQNRIGVIYLYNEFDMVPEERYLSRVAFHEVMEVLLADIHSLAIDRAFCADEYDKEHHRVIRTLEQRVFPILKDVINVPVLQSATKKPKRKRSKVSKAS